jgi:hypothetical protein
MLDGPPKRQFAAHAHQRVLCMWQQMPIRNLQFLIQGEKTRLHTAGRSQRCVPLRPAAPHAFATSVSLVRVLAAAVHTAHTPVPDWLHSRRLHWLGLLVRSSVLAADSSAHLPRVQSRPGSLSGGPLSTAPRRQRCPLLVPPNAFVSLRVCILGFSLLDSGDDSFPLRQCTISWLIPTTPPQQAGGAKKCIAPAVPFLKLFDVYATHAQGCLKMQGCRAKLQPCGKPIFRIRQ